MVGTRGVLGPIHLPGFASPRSACASRQRGIRHSLRRNIGPKGGVMDYWWDILNLVLVFSIFAVSLNLLVGYAGQVSVAHAAFGAVGGYTAAYLSTTAGMAFWPALAAGTLGAG